MSIPVDTSDVKILASPRAYVAGSAWRGPRIFSGDGLR